ncbi:hypothetical protein ACJX0J_039939 [Zea mays]
MSTTLEVIWMKYENGSNIYFIGSFTGKVIKIYPLFNLPLYKSLEKSKEIYAHTHGIEQKIHFMIHFMIIFMLKLGNIRNNDTCTTLNLSFGPKSELKEVIFFKKWSKIVLLCVLAQNKILTQHMHPTLLHMNLTLEHI